MDTSVHTISVPLLLAAESAAAREPDFMRERLRVTVGRGSASLLDDELLDDVLLLLKSCARSCREPRVAVAMLPKTTTAQTIVTISTFSSACVENSAKPICAGAKGGDEGGGASTPSRSQLRGMPENGGAAGEAMMPSDVAVRAT